MPNDYNLSATPAAARSIREAPRSHAATGFSGLLPIWMLKQQIRQWRINDEAPEEGSFF